MTQILLAILLSTSVSISFAQSFDKSKVTEDFFYGTWTDSTKVGFTLTKENLFYFVDKRVKTGLTEIERDVEKDVWRYKIYLDQTPIFMELTCKECGKKSYYKPRTAMIEIMNDRKIYLIFKDTRERILLTKE